jgi:hypothetical protein
MNLNILINLVFYRHVLFNLNLHIYFLKLYSPFLKNYQKKIYLLINGSQLVLAYFYYFFWINYFQKILQLLLLIIIVADNFYYFLVLPH